jgi:hypothetical protein
MPFGFCKMYEVALKPINSLSIYAMRDRAGNEDEETGCICEHDFKRVGISFEF